MKTFIVTGASSGIGLALTHALLAKGHAVWGVSRRSMQHDTPHYHHMCLDLSDEKAVHQACMQHFSKATVTGLLYCAGSGIFGALEQLNTHDFKRIMQINCLSAMMIAKALVPAMKKKKQGKMIFIGSEAALHGAKQGTIYCASKFALRGFTQSLAQELRAAHIDISLINPGLMATAFHDPLHFAPSSEEGCTIDMTRLIHALMPVVLSDHVGFISEMNLQPYRNVIVKK